ncbi:MAG: hypothetical protein PHW10_00310 [Candidatus Peribacteraceae bacterium]|nr:hypothetical protein [Candidatus Peribacteraceae bacterium]
MVLMRPFQPTDPRGDSLLRTEVRTDEHKGLLDFYLNEAKNCEENLTSFTYDIVSDDGNFLGFFCVSNSLLLLDEKEIMTEFKRKKNVSFAPPATLLGKLYICNCNRGTGIGSEVILYIAKEICFKSKSASRFIIIDINARNPNAVNFYTKRGWLHPRTYARKMFFDLLRFKIFLKAYKEQCRNSSAAEILRLFAIYLQEEQN